MPSAGLAAVIFPSFYGFVPSSHSNMPDPSSLLSRANHLTVAYAMEVMRRSLCLDRQPKKRAAVLRPELIVWQLTESPCTESSVCGPTERACLFPHKTALHCSIRWTQKLYLVLRQSGRRKIHCSHRVFGCKFGSLHWKVQGYCYLLLRICSKGTSVAKKEPHPSCWCKLF